MGIEQHSIFYVGIQHLRRKREAEEEERRDTLPTRARTCALPPAERNRKVAAHLLRALTTRTPPRTRTPPLPHAPLCARCLSTAPSARTPPPHAPFAHRISALHAAHFLLRLFAHARRAARAPSSMYRALAIPLACACCSTVTFRCTCYRLRWRRRTFCLLFAARASWRLFLFHHHCHYLSHVLYLLILICRCDGSSGGISSPSALSPPPFSHFAA